MSLLRNSFPEIKSILKGLKSGEITKTNALLTMLYNILIEHCPPQRCKIFLEYIIGPDHIRFCSECGYPKLVTTMTQVFGFDNICTECMVQYYIPDENGEYHHRLDYNPGSLPARISNLDEYNARVDVYMLPKSTTREQARVTKQGYDNLPYLGIELECEARTNCPGNIIVNQVLQAIPDFVMCKSDGSLHNGMEIVSRPATYACHKDGTWEPLFQENDGPAKYLRAWRTDTAGCHVHISRAAFTPIQMAKFLIFINSSENGIFIEKFAGREGERWAKRSPKKAMDIVKATKKYEAVNFSTSAPTLEVRIFRGNISRAGVYRNLEFVQALYAFTRVTSMRELSYINWCEWLSDKVNRKLYPYLHNWCVFNDYIRGKPVATIIKDTTKGI